MNDSKVNDGGPAFPHAPIRDPEGGVDSFWSQWPQPGMSLRDYFAAKAMAAMIGTAGAPCLGGLDRFEPHTAKAAYCMADAMLRARDATPDPGGAK